MKTHQIIVCVHRSVINNKGAYELDDLVEIELNREQLLSFAAAAARKVFKAQNYRTTKL